MAISRNPKKNDEHEVQVGEEMGPPSGCPF
jgi:hypothetical protein